MFPTARYDSGAHRYAPHHDDLDLIGFDWPNAALRMQIRDRKNGGALRADLNQVSTAAAEGVRIDSVTWIDGVPTTRIAWRINKSTMREMKAELLGLAPDANLPMEMDLHVTPVGGYEFIPIAGTLTVLAGVTD